jgi:hypothetical protein
MRIKTALLSIVTGAILTSTGAAHAVTVQKAAFKNTQIALFAFLQEDITCPAGSAVSTGTATAQVFISGGAFVSPFGSGVGTLVEVFGFSNPCTNQSFNEADGFIQGGVTGPNANLTSARLTGSTDANIDFQSAVTVRVSLDLTFTGDGTLSSSKGTTETKTATTPGGPFTITIQRGAFRNRTADVAGTITIGGVLFPVDLDFAATLLDNSSTQITVTK